MTSNENTEMYYTKFYFFIDTNITNYNLFIKVHVTNYF